ncbi:hypothetical protein B566_EDAN007708 [Ephemera danica]|nr:hypothetical protein B566_EDAN007708 [Ephemera danica]
MEYVDCPRRMESVAAHRFVPGTEDGSRKRRLSRTKWMRKISLRTSVLPQAPRLPREEDEGREKEELAWRQLNERSGLLESATMASALLSGFGTQALVDLQFNQCTLVKDPLDWLMSATTTLLVATHIVALSLGTLALPYLQLVWFLAFVLGMFLFLAEVAILSWVKFLDYSLGAAVAGCVVALVGLIGLAVFVLHFHRLLAVHEDESVTRRVQQLELMRERLVASSSSHTQG